MKEKQGLFAFLVFIVIESAKFSLSNPTDDDCSWLIDTVGIKDLEEPVYFIQSDGKYFLRLRVQCYGKPNPMVARSAALRGLAPQVAINKESYGADGYSDGWTLYRLSGALVELGSQANVCSCSQGRCSLHTPRHTCSETTSGLITSDECYTIQPDCSSVTGLCNPAWLVPLPLDGSILRCHVTTNGLAAYFKETEYFVHVDRFHTVVNASYYNVLGNYSTMVPKVENPVSTGCIPAISPGCVLAGFSYTSIVLYTASEFRDIEVIEINGLEEDSDVCSGQFPSLSVVKGAVSLMDRILVYTPAGIKEVLPIDQSSFGIILKKCIKQMAYPKQQHFDTYTVLAWGERSDKELAFVAYPETNVSLQFIELKDNENTSACQTLRNTLEKADSWPCEIISGDVNGARRGEFILLVQLGMRVDDTCSYHLLLYFQASYKVLQPFKSKQGESHSPNISEGVYAADEKLQGTWKLMFNFPTSLDDSKETHHGWRMVYSGETGSGVANFHLTGLSFNAIVGHHLFIWGDVLFYSPDGGSTIQWLTGLPRDSSIELLTTSPDGTYVFMTNSSQLWIGRVGSAETQQLQNSPSTDYPFPGFVANSSTITIFFNSDNVFYQVISKKDLKTGADCLMREEIPFGDILAHQNFLKSRKEIVREITTAAKTNTSCTNQAKMYHNPFAVVPRTCPFAWLQLEASSSARVLHRKEMILRPPYLSHGNLTYPLSVIEDYYTALELLSNKETFSTIISDDRVGGFIQHVHGSEEDEYWWNKTVSSKEVPNMIFLGRDENYTFTLLLYLDYDSHVETSFHSWTLDHLRVSLHPSDRSLLRVLSQRMVLPSHNAVQYQITVCDGEKRFLQRPPGEGLVPASLHIQVWKSALNCINDNKLQGSRVLTVLLGCPPSKKIVFDATESKASSGMSHYCTDTNGVHCFLYERQFLPVFKELDMTTGEQKAFEGMYRLTIVGGGSKLDSIRNYTEQEQEAYNFKGSEGSTSSLIWAAVSKTLGDVPAFNKSTRAIRWLCRTQSPCAGIDPKFPNTAEFYLKLQFSTRDVDADSSNCDHTFQFYVRLHGLPPGSFYPASVIVLSCLGIMMALILASFAFMRKNHYLWKQTKRLAGGRLIKFTNDILLRVSQIKNRKTKQSRGDVMEIDIGDPAPPVVAWTTNETKATLTSDVIEKDVEETTL